MDYAPCAQFTLSGCISFSAQPIQIGQAKQGLQLRYVFDQSPKTGFPISELAFHDLEHVLNLCPRTGNQSVGLLFQVMQLTPRFGLDRGEQDCAFVCQRFGLVLAAVGAVAQYAIFFTM
jgi:hypothetical protein